MNSLTKPEILAPAGDFQKMRFAIAYGADAVYFSGQQFGMRAAAGNFNEQQLEQGIHYAHEHGTKCYITVNIMPSNEDLKALPAYLEKLQSWGADALIVADVGVLSLARHYAPKVPLHISTQTCILNYEAANFWADLGVERVVLARELTLDQIYEIREKTPKSLEIEAFVHGAMCISYSGRCLISQYLTGRDANHGACAQPCRWKYSLVEEKRPNEYFPIVEEEGTYLYNSKDMCMIDHIPELMQAGVSSFKIEGRNKTAYYAAVITSAYRQAVDVYFNNPSDFVLPQDIRNEVDKVSHRNYYTGFYFGEQENGQHYEDSQYIREWEVTAMPETVHGSRAVFKLKNRFYAGEKLELVQPNAAPYRFIAQDIQDLEGRPLVECRHPEMQFVMNFPFSVSPFSILRHEKCN